MYNSKLAIVIGCLLLAVSIALACGPAFSGQLPGDRADALSFLSHEEPPAQLLDDRARTLKATPVNSFEFEVKRLAIRSKDSLKPIEGFQTIALYTAEAAGLSPEQAALVQQMRTASAGDQAFQLGAALAPSVRLYTAGAVDFRRGDMSDAAQRFEAILKLPAADQLLRATWASYMLGRIYAPMDEIDRASAAFQLTRTLAIKGAPDPLGLAVASYGEEARLHLARAAGYLKANRLPQERRKDYGREICAAVGLYAQQAAHQSASGVDSLRMVAERLLFDADALDASITDETVQRLVVAYMLTFKETLFYYTGKELHRLEPNVALGNLAFVIRSGHGFKDGPGTDLLAALTYRMGNYDLARRLADHGASPLASWVKAKLALQRGDLAAAAAFYADASKAFPPANEAQVLDPRNVKLLTAETGVLALARGEYVYALQLLYPAASTYWGDVTYIAERVLTTDELKHFVDVHVAAPTPATLESAPLTLALIDKEDSLFHQGYGVRLMEWLFHASAARLRDLLARRLVREGRYQEALAYFHSPQDTQFKDPDVRKHVSEYAQTLHEAKADWRGINRARAWYRAAVMARTSGMEMMGYEAVPDYFGFDGVYGFDEYNWGQASPGPSLVSDGERQRFAASVPKPNKRFQYRYAAVDEATRAADLLPERSQAFAAVLCHATRWMISSHDDEAVHRIYHRYLREGPYVPWATHFGRSCPQPDFDSAARLPRVLFVRHTRHFIGHHRWQVGLSLALAAVVANIVLVRIRHATTA